MSNTDDPDNGGYMPADSFRRLDNDRSSRRIRDEPFGKRRYKADLLPKELAFGSHPTNSLSLTQKIILTNTGYDDLPIKKIHATGDFLVNTDCPPILRAGEAATIEVSFNPRREGVATGSVYVDTGDAAGTEFAELLGAGTYAEPPTEEPEPPTDTDIAISDVSGLVTALAGKQASLGFTPENLARKNQANGYVGLNSAGQIPAQYLTLAPSNGGGSGGSGLPEAPTDGKIYGRRYSEWYAIQLENGGNPPVDYGPQIQTITGRLTTVETTVQTISGKVATAQQDILTLETDFEALDTRVTEIEESLEDAGAFNPTMLKRPVSYAATDEMYRTSFFDLPSANELGQAFRVQDMVLPFNNSGLSRYNHIASNLRVIAKGSNVNGPFKASIGQGLAIWKEGYGTGAAGRGEIDALYIVLKQDSPRDGQNADGCGILIDASTYQGVGFVGGIEGVTREISNANSTEVSSINYQIGCFDTKNAGQPLGVGFHITANSGPVSYGLMISSATQNGGNFQKPIMVNNNGRLLFELDEAGRLMLGASTGSGLRAGIYAGVDGSFGVLDNAMTSELMKITQVGDASFKASVSSGRIIAATAMASPLVTLPHILNANLKTHISTNNLGEFRVLNGAETTEIFKVKQNGDAVVAGSLLAGSIGTSGGIQAGTLTVSGAATFGSVSFTGKQTFSAVDVTGQLNAGGISTGGALQGATITASGTLTANVLYSKSYLFFDAISNPPAAGGLVYFEAGTGLLKYHNGSTMKTIATL